MDDIRVVSLAPQDIFSNMALDEALFLSAADSDHSGTLRVYQSVSPGVTLGYFQNIGTIDTDLLNKRGIDYTRRITGGRTVLHGDDITFSFAGNRRSSLYAATILKITSGFSEILSSFFHKLDLDISISERENVSKENKSAFCFDSVTKNEILLAGKKIAGLALKRSQSSFLLQGTIPLNIDEALLKAVSGNSGGAGFTSLDECIKERLGFDRLREMLIDAFSSNGFSLKSEALTEKESSDMIRLAEEKYKSSEWKRSAKEYRQKNE